MGKMKFIFLMTGLIFMILSCDDFPREKLELHVITKLLKEPSLQGFNDPRKQITLLPKGSKVVVVSKEYGKDYLAYKVETPEGLQGYVLHSKDTVLIAE